MVRRSSFLPMVLALVSCSAPAVQSAFPCPACPACAASAAPQVVAPGSSVSSQAAVPDKPVTSSDPIIDKQQALARSDSRAYDLVRSLVDETGPRLSGSPGDKAGVVWGVRTMKELGLQNVRAEKVMVPHWERGAESGRIVAPSVHNLALMALGGSVATPGSTFIEYYIEADDGSRSSGRILWCEAITTRKCF